MSKAEMKRRADELGSLIQQAGLTRNAAAERLEHSDRMIRYWLSGEHKIPMSVVLAMRWIAQETR